MIGAFVELAKKVEGLQSNLSDLPSFAERMKPTYLQNLEVANLPLHQDLGDAKTQIDLNRETGDAREATVKAELEEKYPEADGFNVLQEQYLRDDQGKIVKDDVTGEARRIDFMVVKDNEVVASVEVTSETAPKEQQMAKEQRIREQGGNYIKDAEAGTLIPFGKGVQTEVRRLA